MKKTALKATAAALSMSMAIASFSFAQQTAPANTKPLPGSKVAAQAEGLTYAEYLAAGGTLAFAAWAISRSNSGGLLPTTTTTSTR